VKVLPLSVATWIVTPPRFPRAAVGRCPATATAQLLPFHDSFRPAAPEAPRREARARARRARARLSGSFFSESSASRVRGFDGYGRV